MLPINFTIISKRIHIHRPVSIVLNCNTLLQNSGHSNYPLQYFTGSFSNDGINEFLRDLSYGKGRTSPVKGAQIPKISTIEAWDGKDGELPVEEEIDLSDVELDDLDKDEL